MRLVCKEWMLPDFSTLYAWLQCAAMESLASLSVCKCVMCILVYVCLCFFYPAVSYTDEVTEFSKPIEEPVISRAPRFSNYISSISTSALCYMNEINLQGRGDEHFILGNLTCSLLVWKSQWFSSSLPRSSGGGKPALWYHYSLAA